MKCYAKKITDLMSVGQFSCLIRKCGWAVAHRLISFRKEMIASARMSERYVYKIRVICLTLTVSVLVNAFFIGYLVMITCLRKF